MKADSKTEAEILSLIKQYTEAYSRKDLPALLELFAPDPDVVIYGSGPDEKRIGLDAIRAQLERDLAQAEQLSMSIDWVSVSASGSVAWNAADVTIRARVEGKDITLPGRYTNVFEKRGDRWLCVQSHFSIPDTRQKIGSSFPQSTIPRTLP